MNVFNTDTKENLGQIKNIQDVTMTSEWKTDYARDNYGNKIIQERQDHTYEMKFNADKPINTEEFYKILCIDIANMPDAYNIQFIKYVQARKHKKRRINKKWLKRYGYKQMIVDGKGWKIENNTDGSIEFVK